jgi:membrane complex biogenesis BtpA family protein
LALDFLAHVPTPALVGMIHVPALPGTPRHGLAMDAIMTRVVAEAEIYAAAGVDAVMLENMHDLPYLRGEVGSEITAAMAVLAERVNAIVPGPVGVQVLAAANREAVAVALAAGLSFVRVEGFVFGHLADEGWLDACAGGLLRYRRRLGAEQVRILADVKKKHAAHAATADLSLAETARAAVFAGADAVVITGTVTGEAADPAELAAVRQSCEAPVVVGSGVTLENLPGYLAADALVVGSHFKRDGLWSGPLDRGRVEAFVARLRELRSGG